jgi:hypothetical protein
MQLHHFIDSNGKKTFVLNSLPTKNYRCYEGCLYFLSDRRWKSCPAPISPSRTSFTPRSRRAQPRPRITPPSSPTPLSPPVHPRRVRRRPRHFDSSPDLNLPRRCEKAHHVPLKPAHEFIVDRGRIHPICNECRERIQHR